MLMKLDFAKKGSEKGSDLNDLYCNVLKLTKRKKRLKSAFFL
jgi:hypothetical protein